MRLICNWTRASGCSADPSLPVNPPDQQPGMGAHASAGRAPQTCAPRHWPAQRWSDRWRAVVRTAPRQPGRAGGCQDIGSQRPCGDSSPASANQTRPASWRQRKAAADGGNRNRNRTKTGSPLHPRHQRPGTAAADRAGILLSELLADNLTLGTASGCWRSAAAWVRCGPGSVGSNPRPS